MLKRIRALNPGKGLGAIAYYAVCRAISHALLVCLYRLRVWGRERVPATGPLLVILNHQSHYDPVVAGMAVAPRQLNFMARSTLFKGAFAAFIRGLNAVPLKQGAPDTAAIRTAIEQLQAGRCVMIFPEGTRTGDGAMHPFKRGAWVLMSRAGCPILPVAIEGCYDIWRRGTPGPKLFGQRVAVLVGEPIAAEALKAMGPDRGLRHLESTIEGMRLELVRKLQLDGHRVSTRPISAIEEPD